jgi:hypothetical protein
MTHCRCFDNIYLKMPIGRPDAYVTNISSFSIHYRRLTVMRPEVSANVLNRFIFIGCHIRPIFLSSSAGCTITANDIQIFVLAK